MSFLCKYPLLLAFLTFLSLHSHAEILVTEAYIQAVPAGYEDASVYLTLRNSDRYPVYLNKASASVSEKTKLQQYKDNDGAMMLQTINDIKIPANTSLKMQPGNIQITLENLHTRLESGNTIELQLTFSNGKSIITNVSVVNVDL